ncbi:MAG: twin-arginine translocase subunit TatB, partial [Chloroflexi bacterium]|nr:twin-arginine translocase subunit TatB [Chloroflexota bacterium]
MDSFFGIGFPELVTILILAGIVMGPARIGRVARWLGRTTAQLQTISRGFMRQLSAELESVDDG